MRKIVTALLMIFSAMVLSAGEGAGDLKVKVEKFKTFKGSVMITLFKSADGFPSNGEKAAAKGEIKVDAETISQIFKEIPYGEYAVSVYYDENGNKKLDTGLFGIPSEPVGTSNNPKLFGPPKYSDAKFIFSENNKEITIVLANLK